MTQRTCRNCAHFWANPLYEDGDGRCLQRQLIVWQTSSCQSFETQADFGKRVCEVCSAATPE